MKGDVLPSRRIVIFTTLEELSSIRDVQHKLQALGFELQDFDAVLASPKLQKQVTGIVIQYFETNKVNQVLPLLPNLKTISFITAGLDGLDIKQCLQRNVTVGNTSLAMQDDAAEFSIALMLASAKSLSPGELMKVYTGVIILIYRSIFWYINLRRFFSLWREFIRKNRSCQDWTQRCEQDPGCRSLDREHPGHSGHGQDRPCGSQTGTHGLPDEDFLPQQKQAVFAGSFLSMRFYNNG